MLFSFKPVSMVDPADALPGRPAPIPTAEAHFISGRAFKAVPPAGTNYNTQHIVNKM